MAMSNGLTPLHISAESGNIAVLRLLLSNNAAPLTVDKVQSFTFTLIISDVYKCINNPFTYTFVPDGK